MNHTIWKGIYSAVEAGNTYAVTTQVKYLGEQIVERWMLESHENLDRDLCILLQRSQRAKRELVDEEHEVTYQLGVAEGYTRAIERLYRAENQRKSIVETLAKSSGKARLMLECLYQKQGDGMCHGDLAEAIGSSPSALTNLMKRAILSGAVEASRSGKNTYYVLTQAGERYCRQSSQTQPQREEGKELLRRLEKMLQCIEERLPRTEKPRGESENGFPQNIALGDRIACVDNMIPGEPYLCTGITRLDNTNYLNIQLVNGADNRLGEKDGQPQMSNFYQMEYARG